MTTVFTELVSTASLDSTAGDQSVSFEDRYGTRGAVRPVPGVSDEVARFVNQSEKASYLPVTGCL